MTIGYVGGQVMSGSSGQSGSTVAFPGLTVSAGHLIIVGARNGGNQQLTSITDTAGNTYALAVKILQASSNYFELWYAYNSLGASNNIITIRYTPNSPSSIWAAQAEYSGVQTSSSPLDATDSNNNTGTSVSSNSFTASSGELIVSLVNPTNGTTAYTTLPTGFTIRVKGSPTPVVNIADDILTGSYSGTMTWSGMGSDTYGILTASFKATSSASDNLDWNPRDKTFIDGPLGLVPVR
jgi:hypothetical protein